MVYATSVPTDRLIVREKVPLGPLTTLGIGGPAARLVDVTDEAELTAVLTEADRRREPVLVLGRGSNLVIADRGFDGLVVRMALRGIDVRRDADRVTLDAAAGEDWDDLVARAVDEGWAGLECMSGIPGLVGATPVQNVGAYGQDVSQTVTQVRVFDRARGELVTLAPPECGFGYRASVFKRSDRWVVTGVRFVLRKADASPVRYGELARALSAVDGQLVPARQLRPTVLALRRAKGMVLDPSDPDSVSAGSFFVNPILDAAALALVEARAGERPPRFDAGESQVKVPAAWLVERAGFVKGWGQGRVGVSRKHALALVNRGGATAAELVDVARAIRDGVRARFGVTLAPEPVFAGFSGDDERLQGE
jgi:UDP-N-acetylmuramate dehydrogenase